MNIFWKLIQKPLQEVFEKHDQQVRELLTHNLGPKLDTLIQAHTDHIKNLLEEQHNDLNHTKKTAITELDCIRNRVKELETQTTHIKNFQHKQEKLANNIVHNIDDLCDRVRNLEDRVSDCKITTESTENNLRINNRELNEIKESHINLLELTSEYLERTGNNLTMSATYISESSSCLRDSVERINKTLERIKGF